MEGNSKVDIIDGKMINWDELTLDELKALEKKYMEEEKKIRSKIEDLVKIDNVEE